MGRTRSKKKGAVKAADPNVQGPNQPSLPSLLQKAQSLIVQCDYDLAQRFLRRILEQHPANPEAKEMLGVVLLETGEIAAAKEVKEIVPRSYYCPRSSCVWQTFLSLLPPHPDAPSPPPSSAHLYLAQLSEDDPRVALQHYQNAIDILSLQLKGKGRAKDDSDADEVKGNIVRALVGQVEIWMDPSYDLWYDDLGLQTLIGLTSAQFRARGRSYL